MIIQPHIIKNFILNDTIKVLNNWACETIKQHPHYFTDPQMGLKDTRFTTRYYKDCNKLSFPVEALDLRVKIADFLNIESYKDPDYCNGIVCGIGYKNGDIYEHTDPVYHEGTYTLHCNAITQSAEEGGITIIEGIEYPTKPNDILVYPVSKVRHSVSTIKGNTPRILWVFGYCIDNETKIY